MEPPKSCPLALWRQKLLPKWDRELNEDSLFVVVIVIVHSCGWLFIAVHVCVRVCKVPYMSVQRYRLFAIFRYTVVGSWTHKQYMFDLFVHTHAAYLEFNSTSNSSKKKVWIKYHWYQDINPPSFHLLIDNPLFPNKKHRKKKLPETPSRQLLILETHNWRRSTVFAASLVGDPQNKKRLLEGNLKDGFPSRF